MGIIEITLIAIGLGMDAFAVAVCKGLSMKKMKWQNAVIVGLYFGIFQALMPIIGYFLGVHFENVMKKFDHWIAFMLLSVVGINMIHAVLKENKEVIDEKMDYKTMTPLAIATSIDALAVGITFAFLQVNVILAIITIGVIAFLLSFLGVKIGNIFEDRYEKRAEIIGGIILILMGTKILLEHLEIIQF